jgi:hypothetical protein
MMFQAIRARLAGSALAAALLIGCGGGGSATPDAKEALPCPIGDLSAPAEIQIVHLDENNAVIETQAMQTVPLIAPPQGGWIVLLGVRAKNIDCRPMLTTALVDTCDDQILSIDVRSTQLDVGADGWGVSSLTSFGNLAVCPQLTAARDLTSVPYTMRVAIEDAAGQKAESSLTVVPTCPDGTSRCACECNHDYVVGRECATTQTPHTTCPTP